MHRWMDIDRKLYIPAKWGYGVMKMDGIPAHCTLIFELGSVKIER